MPPISVWLYAGPLWLSSLFGALYLVWLLNLYNFMDGIDGLASVEAICVAWGPACCTG